MFIRRRIVVKSQTRSHWATCLAFDQLLLIGLFRVLGIELELACNGGSCGGMSLNNLHVKRLHRMSLDCKLVPVQYREYEIGLLSCVISHHLAGSMTVKDTR